jgi:hypothetical protein
MEMKRKAACVCELRAAIIRQKVASARGDAAPLVSLNTK